MSVQMIVRIDAELKRKLSRLARAEGRSASQVVRELLENHVKNRDIRPYVSGLWDRIGRKLKRRKASLAQVRQAVRAARRDKR